MPLGAAIFALSLASREVEIGFPENFRNWRFASPGAHGSLGQTEFLGKRCLCFDLFFAGKNRFAEISFSKPLKESSFRELKVEFASGLLKELVIRSVDATGQVFQYRYPLNPGEGWQTVSCRFDNASGLTGWPVTIWGGAKDKKFHFPLKGIGICTDCVMKSALLRDSDFLKCHIGKVTIVTQD